MRYILAVVSILMMFFISGCNKIQFAIYGKTTILRNDLQVVCRDNDGIILASSYFVSNGKIYYLEKSDNSWKIKQTIDLAPYLKGWHTLHIPEDNKWRDDFTNSSIVYNDRWLAITARKKSAGTQCYGGEDDRGKAIIFKKEDGIWKYYYTLNSKKYFIYANCIALTDFDQLITSDPYKKENKTFGVVRCFDLKGEKPNLVQEIYPPKENIAPSGSPGDFGTDFCVNDNQLLIEFTGENPVIIQTDFMLYHFTDHQWQYCQSFVDQIPEEISHAWERRPLNNTKKMDIAQDSITFHMSGCPNRSIRFKMKGERYAYDQSCFKDFEIREQRLGVQTPDRYAFVWQGKRDRFGLTKKSTDDVIRFADPDWIVDDADPETNKLVTGYYKHDFNPKFSAEEGYKSFYDYTNYVPQVDYALSGRTLITSYFFEDCYFTGNPMQKAEVWGGVNIYEIDPETGPQKVFALTTKGLEDLKPASVAE